MKTRLRCFTESALLLPFLRKLVLTESAGLDGITTPAKRSHDHIEYLPIRVAYFRSRSIQPALHYGCAGAMSWWLFRLSHISALCSTGILPKETPPQRSEPRADLLRKELRLFPGSKVAAFLNLVEM